MLLHELLLLRVVGKIVAAADEKGDHPGQLGFACVALIVVAQHLQLSGCLVFQEGFIYIGDADHIRDGGFPCMAEKPCTVGNGLRPTCAANPVQIP